jgi:hypothetical protein
MGFGVLYPTLIPIQLHRNLVKTSQTTPSSLSRTDIGGAMMMTYTCNLAMRITLMHLLVLLMLRVLPKGILDTYVFVLFF